ncbi:nuclear transport factor 2 family protein [Silvibacterium acidisoli]|uniref:nuclear transport factor 2 family protein n=1 Tax=Acidobacteriaceae bacterium ZG23-2 TaxID=2883246 RepID=UPI00406CC63D
MTSTRLSGVVEEHINAVNASDINAVVETFADDALVNDNRREIVGVAAIRRWLEKEIIGDSVRIEVREVVAHYSTTIVRGAYDGTFDKTNLPAELILTSYFNVVEGKIVSLMIIFNQPSPY